MLLTLIDRFKEIEGMAIDIRKKCDGLPPHLIFEKEGKLVIAMLEYGGTDEGKEVAIDFIRELVQRYELPRYFTFFEGWMSERKGDSPWIRPSKDVQRKSVIVISEYRRSLKNRTVAIVVKDNKDNKDNKDDTFEIEKRIDMSDKGDDKAYSIWNVYLEKEGIAERNAKTIDQREKDFIKSELKLFTKEFKARMLSCRTDADRQNVAEEMNKFVNERRDYWRSQIHDDET